VKNFTKKLKNYSFVIDLEDPKVVRVLSTERYFSIAFTDFKILFHN